MKAKACVVVFLLAMVWPALAQEGLLTYMRPPGKANSQPSGVPIGNGHFKLQGPLVQDLKPHPSAAAQGLGQRILGSPFVRLFVPKPLPAFSAAAQYPRSYFAWSEPSPRPWDAVPPDMGAEFGFHNVFNQKPVNGLISLSW